MITYLLLCCASVLERLQSFLPQMAEANEKLKQQMEEAPVGCFDIESVQEAERVIEMVSVSLLVKLSRLPLKNSQNSKRTFKHLRKALLSCFNFIYCVI